MITFDLDKTLFEELEPHGYKSAQLVRDGTGPHTAACSRVWDLIDAGVDVAFVTRRAGSTLRAVTLEQVRAWIHGDIQDDQVHQPDAWTGYEAAMDWTVLKLCELRPAAHVGDHDVLDRLAAGLAGVPFLHADAWRRGDPLPLTA